MISDKLKQDALDFLSAVEAVAKDEGYQAAKKEFDAQAAQLKYDYDKRIVEAQTPESISAFVGEFLKAGNKVEVTMMPQE